MSYPIVEGLYSEEHEIFRESFRRFLKEEAEPNIERWLHNHQIDPEFWRKAGAAGILAVDIPEEYGGPGGDFEHRLIIAEELGYSLAGATIGTAIIGDGVSEIIYRGGTEAHRRKYLPPMATGELRGALAITEPDSGSDVSGLKTNARREGDAFVINGSKTYISNSATAGVFVVACRTELGVSAIIIEGDTPGFKRGRSLKKMGMNACDTGELFFEDVRVPVTNLMGEEGHGMRIVLGGVNMDRITWPLLGHAAATRAFHEALEFTKNRKGFGKTIFDFQNTQFKLADIKTELEISRSFLNDVIRDYRANGKLNTLKVAMAKLYYAEMEGRIIDQCVQMHGGAGYMAEYTVSHLYTAARLHRIFGGTSEIMRVIVARSL
jgi:alkylation response protein AidB-like acyl-CoA dehydrogenase